MNWITTNIRLPEEVYMDLKVKAARERKSVAALIREKIIQPEISHRASNLMEQLQKVSRKIEKTSRVKSLSETLIKSRYEHL
jgi:predicted DNA-binding protein